MCVTWCKMKKDGTTPFPAPEGELLKTHFKMKQSLHAGANKWMYQRARELRYSETHAESILGDI